MHYILLDWDGNLAQTLDVWPDALDVVLRRRGIALSRTQLVKACGGVAAFLSTHAGLSMSEGQQVLQDATAIVKQRLPSVELYPGVTSVLRELKEAGMKLAVITSSVRSVVEPLIDKHDMGDIFDAVVCIEDTANRKPHAEPVLKALGLIGGSKELALMIGDTEKDILAAKNAGVDSVLFYPPAHRAFYDLDDLRQYEPTYVMHEFKDLVGIVGA